MNLSRIERVVILVTCFGILGSFLVPGFEYALRHKVETPAGEPALLAVDGSVEPIPTSGQRGTYRLFDENVVPASMTQSAALLATAVAGAGPTVTVSTVSTGDVIWSVDAQTTTLELTKADGVIISGEKSSSDKVSVKEGGVPNPVSSDDGKNWAYTLRNNLQSTTRIEISIEGGNTQTITLIPPDTDSKVDRPVVTNVATNAFARPSPYPGSPDPRRVYGRYVRLTGERVSPGTELRFLVIDEKKNVLGYARGTSSTPPHQDGIWDTTLELPLHKDLAQAGDQGNILVQAKLPGSSSHAYSTAVVPFQIKLTVENPLDAPTTLKLWKSEDTKTAANEIVKQEDGVIRWNQKTFYVAGKASGSAEVLSDSTIALFRGTQILDITDIKITGGEWIGKVDLDAEGPFELRAATTLGKNLVGPKSAPLSVELRTTRPKIASAESVNSLAKIKVVFDRAIVVPASGDLIAAFKLVDSQKSEHDVIVTPAPPTLDKTDNSLELTFANVHPESYTLTVDGSKILDLFGNAMAGKPTFEFFKAVGENDPSIAIGITGPTGRYVEFPEYTKPRQIINGFNPSDRVETRVARLYYERDAHRVAQIINREVKSYNRTGVDMQRQLADKSRQIADQATDDRRAKERNAVRAAQNTREAERELQQAEQSAQSASQQAANASMDLQQTDATLRGMAEDDTNRANTQARATNLQNVVNSLEGVASAARARAREVANKVQQLREQEAQAHEQWQASISVEDRSREEQFRREVAAAHADPDTYVPGDPESDDPVRRVSVSVIGEGLIQLRGPIKGINIIRTMINQIDAPVGQVRVGVHTVQINGEKGDRMEVVAGKIQRYIDHSRFLTLQSAEMLRKAIVQVAAQRAMEAGNVPSMTQEERDRSYLYAFFGEDFIHELEAMDSEFLGTGNKLLSIHSMDSTSLASAMFILALAKNTTRMQILQTFEGMMQGELPMAEQNYFEAGLTCDGKQKLFGKYCNKDEFCMLSQNARFQSIRGMFNVEIAEDDTMTPIQHEFVRLAQIFKSRLIVEMELKQRVMERSVIEERVGDPVKQAQQAKLIEDAANEVLAESRKIKRESQQIVLSATQKLDAHVRDAKQTGIHSQQMAGNAITLINQYQFAKNLASAISKSEKFMKTKVLLLGLLEKNDIKDPEGYLEDLLAKREKEFWSVLENPMPPNAPSFGERVQAFRVDYYMEIEKRRLRYEIPDEEERANVIAEILEANKKRPSNFRASSILHAGKPDEVEFDFEVTTANEVKIVTNREKVLKILNEYLDNWATTAEKIKKDLAQFEYTAVQKGQLKRADDYLAQIHKREESEVFDNLFRALTMFDLYGKVAAYLVDQTADLPSRLDVVNAGLIRDDEAQIGELYEQWVSIDKQVGQTFVDTTLLSEANDAFRTLLEQELKLRFSAKAAEEARRPLDHKKFLDMLVDEMEDKFIELVEGTRAHTANIDAYIKRLITSLDDDFNTQFYYPTFRKVREASQMWDVQMGQVETTNVLANNRAFAKVSPEATMEFDLPKRDILIAEAMNGAKAMMNDFGALAQDPTFLAMAQMGSGGSTASPAAGSTGGQATVRNVLPGLSTDTAESVMSQQGPGGSKFGSAMEALIPDPAIYKFETGTGWEIRPVIQPDGQALVFHFNYMYTTNIREPVRADEKHLGRVKRHFVDTDVQLSNFELREISRYTVALKASRTSRGVPLFEDVPVVGVLFRPQPSDESSLQQNVILGQATIFPTVFDLMGLRWAPVVADLDPLRLSNDEFIVRNRRRALTNRVFDHSSSEVDKFLRIPDGERRMDLYRSQETIPSTHPNGYDGPGANLRDSQLQEGYDPTRRSESQFIPSESIEGSPSLRRRNLQSEPQDEVPLHQPQASPADFDNSSHRRQADSPNGVANVDYRARTGDPRFPGQQAEYVTTQPSRTEPHPAARMQRLPPVDGAPPPSHGQITRPIAR